MQTVFSDAVLFLGVKQTVRGITCMSYNLYYLNKITLCLFNNDLKMRLSKVTYLGYI